MTQAAAPPRDVLTQLEAEERARRVANVSYALHIALTRGGEGYDGTATIRFDARGEDDLFLDFRGKEVRSAELNGEPLETAHRNYRIVLPGSWVAASNELRIAYHNAYDRTGDGFHHYIDPEDGEEYLYTNFEPYDAHRLFPCFDQPDIKAQYRLTVTAPAEWTVLANGREASANPTPDGRLTRAFEPTQPFSTYLFALVVGPYHAVHRDHRGLRMGLLCRRSLARFLDPDELFTVTAQGMDFYADLFGRAYPFTKYDQIFCPEFNIGAMENVGAVTIAESFIYRDPPTETQRRSRAELVLHELAHMWFGNLVTLRWWNDLWLNESFASYIAYLAIAEATRFAGGAWKAFNSEMKRWAYRQDQLPTTHPISGSVPDTDATFLNFDGITYGKGAAVLKQLVATIGLEAFRDGMRLYFRRHAFGNATLADFLAALEEGSGRPLGEWSRLWLETASLNTLSAEWETRDGQLSRLELRQTAPPAYPTLRPHALRIALGSEADGSITVEAIAAEISGPSAEVPAAAGRRPPRFVFPNHDDHAYAKVALDAESVAYVRGNVQRVVDPLLRQLLWMSLWEMVRDRRLGSIDYLALAGEQLPVEPDLEISDAMLVTVQTALSSYVPEEIRVAQTRRFFSAARAAVGAVAPGDAQITWARALIAAAGDPDDVAALLRLADGHDSVPGLTVDQEMRWSIAVRAAAFALDGAEGRLQAERRRDPSDRAERAARRAEAARPDEASKALVWERLVADEYPSLQLAGEAMAGFNWHHQRALLEPYVERFFEAVPGVFERTENRYAVTFARHLFPSYRPEPEVLERSGQLVAELGDRQPMLTRMLREANDELERAIACRAHASAR